MIRYNLQFFGGRGASGTMKNSNGKVIAKKNSGGSGGNEKDNNSNIKNVGRMITEQNEDGDEVYVGREYTVVNSINGKDQNIIVNEHVSSTGVIKDAERLAKRNDNGFSIAYGMDNTIVLDGMEFKPWDSKAYVNSVNSTGKSVSLTRTYQPDVFVKTRSGEFERPILDVRVRETTAKNGDKRYKIERIDLNGRIIVDKRR